MRRACVIGFGLCSQICHKARVHCAPNKKGAPKGELPLRTSIVTDGSKGGGGLALRGTFLLGTIKVGYSVLLPK